MILKYLSKKFYLNLLIIISIFLVDRISKTYVINFNKEFVDINLFSSAFLNITLVWNSGIAFGLLSIKESYFYLSIYLYILLLPMLGEKAYFGSILQP